MTFKQFALALFILSGTLWLHPSAQAAESLSLLNVSYDPTRELYQEFNAAFAKHWLAKTGQSVNIKQSHGGSSKQARAALWTETLGRGGPGIPLPLEVPYFTGDSHNVVRKRHQRHICAA